MIASLLWLTSYRPSRGATLAVVLAVICYGVALYRLKASLPKTEQHIKQSQGNLERIGIALRCYHDHHGVLPPASICDSSGQPLYSWRVLLLPYLGKRDLYERFDKEKAWDSPENLPLANEYVAAFHLPGSSPCRCGYYAVVGKGTAFEPSKNISLSDVADGLHRTLGIVEARSWHRSWAEPFDLEIDRMARVIGDRADELPGPDEDPFVRGLMLNGKTAEFFYPPDASFRAMATIAKGDELDPIDAEVLDAMATREGISAADFQGLSSIKPVGERISPERLAFASFRFLGSPDYAHSIHVSALRRQDERRPVVRGANGSMLKMRREDHDPRGQARRSPADWCLRRSSPRA